MSAYWEKFSKRWSETAAGTTAGVTATHAAEAGNNFLVTGIQCSGDAAALVTIESPSSTIIWRKRFAAAFTMSETFNAVPIEIATQNQAVLVRISASTANCEANIQGGTI